MIKPYTTRHLLNGRDYGEPRDWQGLEIEKSWLDDKADVKVNITDLSFVHEAKDYIKEYIQNGMLGGKGIFEGIPYQIKVGNIQNPNFVFDGFLDLTDVQIFGNEEVRCGLKKAQGTDWLNDVADGFSFAYLYDIGVITDSDFKKIPYVINKIPDSVEIALLYVTMYILSKDLAQATAKLASLTAMVVENAIPEFGFGAGLGAVAVTTFQIPEIMGVVIDGIVTASEITLLIIQIKALAEQIFAQLLPKQREHLGMTFKKMFEKSCSHLDLKFQSTITDLDLVFIPQKDKKGGEKGLKGFPSNNDSFYTFGDLIRVMKQMFNADFVIDKGKFIFERVDYFKNNGGYKIPQITNEQKRFLDVNSFNANEIISNYVISYQYDTQDTNTLDDTDGMVFQAITEPKAVNNKSMVSIKNLTEINIPFALATPKNDLTQIEETIKDFGKLIDEITGVLGGGTNFEKKIEKRKGSMNLTSHFISVGKIVKMNGSKLQSDQTKFVGASNLWEKYHYVNSFAEVKGKHNQYFIYRGLEVPMTLEEFSQILENNGGITKEGELFEIEKIVYKPEQRIAVMDYRINRKFTNNLKISYVG